MDGTRDGKVTKRRLNRMADIRKALTDLARNLENEMKLVPEERKLDPKSVTVLVSVYDTLGKYVEKKEIEDLKKRVDELKKRRDGEPPPPALAVVPGQS